MIGGLDTQTFLTLYLADGLAAAAAFAVVCLARRRSASKTARRAAGARREAFEHRRDAALARAGDAG